jgi:hypothetical protein
VSCIGAPKQWDRSKRRSGPCGFWKAVDRRSASALQLDASELPEESTMTRFQRVLLLSAVCGVIALGIAYLIIVLLG